MVVPLLCVVTRPVASLGAEPVLWHVVPCLEQWMLVWSPGSWLLHPKGRKQSCDYHWEAMRLDRYGSGLGDWRPSFPPNSCCWGVVPSCFCAAVFPSWLFFWITKAIDRSGWRFRWYLLGFVKSRSFVAISTLLRGCFTFNFCSPTMRRVQKYLNTRVAYFLSGAGITAVVLKHPVLVWLC